MPKLKTHSGAKKRFALTASGRLRRAHAYHQHNFRTKSPSQDRRLSRPAFLEPADARRVRPLLPYR